MTKRVAVAAAKMISADEAAGFVESGMWLDYGTSLCQPDVFDHALAVAHHRADERQDPPLPDDAASRRARGRSRRPSCPLVQPALLGLRPARSTMPGAATTSRSILVKSPTTIGASSIRSIIVILKTCPIDDARATSI